MKNINIITGLPRSGTTLIASIMAQNPEIMCHANSSLCTIMQGVHNNWFQMSQDDVLTKKNVMRGIVDGYYQNTTQSIVFDTNTNWIPIIPVLEDTLGYKVKVMACVRNPAEILASYERQRSESPLQQTEADMSLGPKSSIESRAYYYMGPEGVLGTALRNLKDHAFDKRDIDVLFVDYTKLCSSPKSQMKRIYEFFGLTDFQHNFDNITPLANGVRTKLSKLEVQPVQHLGIELYNKTAATPFWNAWV